MGGRALWIWTGANLVLAAALLLQHESGFVRAQHPPPTVRSSSWITLDEGQALGLLPSQRWVSGSRDGTWLAYGRGWSEGPCGLIRDRDLRERHRIPLPDCSTLSAPPLLSLPDGRTLVAWERGYDEVVVTELSVDGSLGREVAFPRPAQAQILEASEGAHFGSAGIELRYGGDWLVRLSSELEPWPQGKLEPVVARFGPAGALILGWLGFAALFCWIAVGRRTIRLRRFVHAFRRGKVLTQEDGIAVLSDGAVKLGSIGQRWSALGNIGEPIGDGAYRGRARILANLLIAGEPALARARLMAHRDVMWIVAATLTSMVLIVVSAL